MHVEYVYMIVFMHACSIHYGTACSIPLTVYMYLEAAGLLEGRCSDWEQQMVPQETEDIQWFQCDPPVLPSQVESCL